MRDKETERQTDGERDWIWMFKYIKVFLFDALQRLDSVEFKGMKKGMFTPSVELESDEADPSSLYKLHISLEARLPGLRGLHCFLSVEVNSEPQSSPGLLDFLFRQPAKLCHSRVARARGWPSLPAGSSARGESAPQSPCGHSLPVGALEGLHPKSSSPFTLTPCKDICLNVLPFCPFSDYTYFNGC